MNAIRIRRTIDSDTLHLPELKPLLGRTVEIIVLEEETPSTIRPGTDTASPVTQWTIPPPFQRP